MRLFRKKQPLPITYSVEEMQEMHDMLKDLTTQVHILSGCIDEIMAKVSFIEDYIKFSPKMTTNIPEILPKEPVIAIESYDRITPHSRRSKPGKDLHNYLKIKEAAKFLGVSDKKLRSLETSGRIRGYQYYPSGAIYFLKKELQEFSSAAQTKRVKNVYTYN